MIVIVFKMLFYSFRHRHHHHHPCSLSSPSLPLHPPFLHHSRWSQMKGKQACDSRLMTVGLIKISAGCETRHTRADKACNHASALSSDSSYNNPDIAENFKNINKVRSHRSIYFCCHFCTPKPANMELSGKQSHKERRFIFSYHAKEKGNIYPFPFS